MSYHSHRRPTPVPTDSIFVFGREIGQLPSISESPPEKPERAFTHSMESIDSLQGNVVVTEPLCIAKKAWLTGPVTDGPNKSSDNGTTVAGTGTNRINNVNTEITEITESKEDIEEKEPLVSASEAKANGNEPKTDYINLHFSTNGLNEIEKEKEHRNSYVPKVFQGPEENVKEALLSLFFIVFNVAWSIGIGFWHRGDGNASVGHLTLAIIILSGVIIELAYFFNGNIKKGEIWKSSKLLGLLFLIPWTLPIFMSLANVVFAAKEAKDPKYLRPWSNSRMIFLIESLTLAFPQCIVQLCFLMEERVIIDGEESGNFPSIKGAIIAIGLLILSGGMTYARARYDSAKKVDHFGVGMEKYIRYSVIWASKVLWLLTYCCLLVSIRILYGKENYITVVLSILVLCVLYEIPIMVSAIEACNRFTSACISLFFLLPQFAALISLLMWVNVDDSVYKYNFGSCVLGMFFWVESLCIMGWLLDRCTGREADFISEYPHFFGNLFKRCFK